MRTGLPSKSAALAEEAILAARHIAADPYCTRGGPWSHPRKLSVSQLAEIRLVAKCKSFCTVREFMKENPLGSLARHLQNLNFEKPGQNNVDEVVRGFVVVRKRSGRSGAPGSERRRKLILLGKLKQGSEPHLKSKYGKDVALRRHIEIKRRPSRAMKTNVCFYLFACCNALRKD